MFVLSLLYMRVCLGNLMQVPYKRKCRRPCQLSEVTRMIEVDAHQMAYAGYDGHA